MYISAKSFCLCNNVDCILLYLTTVFFIELSLVEVGLDRSEVCEDIVFEAFSDRGASSSIWVLKASGIGVWELGSSSFRF